MLPYPCASHAMYRDGADRVIHVQVVEEDHWRHGDQATDETDSVSIPRINQRAWCCRKNEHSQRGQQAAWATAYCCSQIWTFESQWYARDDIIGCHSPVMPTRPPRTPLAKSPIKKNLPFVLNKLKEIHIIQVSAHNNTIIALKSLPIRQYSAATSLAVDSLHKHALLYLPEYHPRHAAGHGSDERGRGRATSQHPQFARHAECAATVEAQPAPPEEK